MRMQRFVICSIGSIPRTLPAATTSALCSTCLSVQIDSGNVCNVSIGILGRKTHLVMKTNKYEHVFIQLEENSKVQIEQMHQFKEEKI